MSQRRLRNMIKRERSLKNKNSQRLAKRCEDIIAKNKEERDK